MCPTAPDALRIASTLCRAQDRLLATVPAFILSGSPLADTKAVTDYVPARSFWHAVSHLDDGAHRSPSFLRAPESTPEVILAVTSTTLGATAGHTEAAKIEGFGASSMCCVPYVVADGYDSPEGARRVALHSVEELVEDAALATNGVSDFLVAEVSGREGASDERVKELVRFLNDKTNGKYVVVMTGNQSTAGTPGLVLEFAEKEQVGTRRQLQARDPSRPPQIPLTPGILTGLLVGGLLFVIFINGFCCLFSLQTPKKFETE